MRIIKRGFPFASGRVQRRPGLSLICLFVQTEFFHPKKQRGRLQAEDGGGPISPADFPMSGLQDLFQIITRSISAQGSSPPGSLKSWWAGT